MQKQCVACKLPFSFVSYSGDRQCWWPSETHGLMGFEMPLFSSSTGEVRFLSPQGKSLSLFTFVTEMQGPTSVFNETLCPKQPHDLAVTFSLRVTADILIREQACASSVLCMLFNMVIMPLLLMDLPPDSVQHQLWDLWMLFIWWLDGNSLCSIVFCFENVMWKSYDQRVCGQDLEQRAEYGKGRDSSKEVGTNEKTFS